MILLALLFLAPSAVLAALLAVLVAWDHVRDRFARGDRRRHIAACSAYGGKLVLPSSTVTARAVAERLERERIASGVALAEAMALQLEELRSLPETTARRSSWS